MTSSLEDLERRLMARKARGSADEFWLLATRRAQLATVAPDGGQAKQHLALAAIFAGRGVSAGERLEERLAAYVHMFERAHSHRCLAEALRPTWTRAATTLRNLRGGAEPRITHKKAKTIGTDIAMFMVCDAESFEDLSDPAHSFGDHAIDATTRSGRALFISTSCDGATRHEIRIADGAEPSLLDKELKKLTSSTNPQLLHVSSGTIRVGAPGASRHQCLELEAQPGTYRVALHNLGLGTKVDIVACRTDLALASNESPEFLSTDGAP